MYTVVPEHISICLHNECHGLIVHFNVHSHDTCAVSLDCSSCDGFKGNQPKIEGHGSCHIDVLGNCLVPWYSHCYPVESHGCTKVVGTSTSNRHGSACRIIQKNSTTSDCCLCRIENTVHVGILKHCSSDTLSCYLCRRNNDHAPYEEH